MTLEELSQPHLAAAVVDRCGGRSEPVPWEKIALAIWRAFPDRASLRRGQLPDTYSIQTWVWDAKTKFGLLEGGNREGGWRVTEKGARWLDANPSISEHIRDILLEDGEYANIEPNLLVLQCLEADRAASRSAVVVEAFRRFPAVFSLGGDGMWPDAGTVDRALSTALAEQMVSREGDAYVLTRGGRKHRDASSGLTRAEQEKTSTRRRSIASQYVQKVLTTDAYRLYLDTGDQESGEDLEFYRLIQCPPNAGLVLIEASVSELLRNLAQGGRPDLEAFVRAWTQRVVPELAGRGLVGGEKR